MVCDGYSDLKRPLILKAQTCNTDINTCNLSLEDKSIFIINYINLQHSPSNTLVQMFNVRKRPL